MLAVDVHTVMGNFELQIKTHFSDSSITVIYGPSGSGKSTLLDFIAGFSRPSQPSSISLNDQSWLDKRHRYIPVHKRRVAYVTQTPSLFPHLNIAGNLQYALTRSQRHESPTDMLSIHEIAEQLEISHLYQKFPSQISGGEQQRIAIARALLSSPCIMLFDEPVSALDEENREKTLSLLEALHHDIKVPCLYVTHSVNEMMRLADNVLILNNGKMQSHEALNKTLTNLSYPTSQHESIGVVLTGTITSCDTAFNLTEICIDHQLHIKTASCNLSHQIGSRVRLRIYAKDVSIALRKPEGSSILNIIAATIDDIVQYSASQSIVKLSCSTQTLLSLVTNKSVSELSLTTGQQVFAQLKGVAVLGGNQG